MKFKTKETFYLVECEKECNFEEKKDRFYMSYLMSNDGSNTSVIKIPI